MLLLLSIQGGLIPNLSPNPTQSILTHCRRFVRIMNFLAQKILNLLHVPEFISDENDLYLQKERTKLGTYITNYTISGQVINFNTRNYA